MFFDSVCQPDYCKTNPVVSLKLDVVIEATSRKN